MLSAFMGLLDPGDEVIVFEPFFDQCVCGTSYFRCHLNQLLQGTSTDERSSGVDTSVILKWPVGKSYMFPYTPHQTHQAKQHLLRNGLWIFLSYERRLQVEPKCWLVVVPFKHFTSVRAKVH